MFLAFFMITCLQFIEAVTCASSTNAWSMPDDFGLQTQSSTQCKNWCQIAHFFLFFLSKLNLEIVLSSKKDYGNNYDVKRKPCVYLLLKQIAQNWSRKLRANHTKHTFLIFLYQYSIKYSSSSKDILCASIFDGNYFLIYICSFIENLRR